MYEAKPELYEAKPELVGYTYPEADRFAYVYLQTPITGLRTIVATLKGISLISTHMSLTKDIFHSTSTVKYIQMNLTSDAKD